MKLYIGIGTFLPLPFIVLSEGFWRKQWTWSLWIRASWYNYEYNQWDATI